MSTGNYKSGFQFSVVVVLFCFAFYFVGREVVQNSQCPGTLNKVSFSLRHVPMTT